LERLTISAVLDIGERRDAKGDGLPETGRRPARVLVVARTIAHFSYYQSVLAALLDRGAEVEIVFDETWSQKWHGGDQTAVREFLQGRPELKTGWSVRRSDAWRGFIFAVRELSSYRSYLVRPETTPYYVERWRKYLKRTWLNWAAATVFQGLLRTDAAGKLLKLAEDTTPPDRRIQAFLRERRPDVIVATPLNMRFSEETDYVKAAQRLGIPTLTPVLTWDSLSTKGLIQIIPDRVLVWNEHQHKDAVQIHGIAEDRLTIAGAPFFDKWFSARAEAQPREAFCRQLGFDPDRRILLYLGSSKNIAANETWFLNKLLRWIRDSRDPVLRGCQLLVRPHPANAKIYEGFSGEGVRVFPEGGALPETRESFAQMRDSFFHADAALGINTSGMIDSVLAGVPTFSVLIERYAATQSDSLHFRYLETDGALYLEDDVRGFFTTLGKVFKGEDPKAENRRAFARKFARPQGLERSAGEVVAEAVLDLALADRA
jgi:hypothetical protein